MRLNKRYVIMREIINYLRQCFCKHDWIVEEKFIESHGVFTEKQDVKIYMRCKKCGYHTKHWKFV